jgi:hypothetical protein
VDDKGMNVSVWRFEFKIDQTEFQYIFTNKVGDGDNIQTTLVRVLNPYQVNDNHNLIGIDRKYFKDSPVYTVNSTYSVGRAVYTGPRIGVILTEDYHRWLWDRFAYFQLITPPDVFIGIEGDITEPGVYRFEATNNQSAIKHSFLAKYMLDEHGDLVGPIFLADLPEATVKQLETTKGRDLLKGYIIEETIPFNLIRKGTIKNEQMHFSYDLYLQPDEYNDLRNPVLIDGAKAIISMDIHHHDRITPQNRYTKITTHDSGLGLEKDITMRTDFSDEIKGFNKQDGMYFLTKGDESRNHVLWEFEFFNYSNKHTWKHFLNPGKLLLPYQHELNLKEYYNRITSFVYTTFDPHDLKLHHSENVQPLMSYFNPYKKIMKHHRRISTDLVYTTGEEELTFANRINHQSGILNMDINDRLVGRLLTNAYMYNEYEEYQAIKDLYNELLGMRRGNVVTPEEQVCPQTEEFVLNCMCEYCKDLAGLYSSDEYSLIGYILNTFTSRAKPISLEGTLYAYTKEMLIDYILENDLVSATYKKNELQLFRKRCEKVVAYDINTDTWVGIGKQPTGGYEMLNMKDHNTAVKMWNGGEYLVKEYDTSDILYTFNFDSFPSQSLLNEFRMFANDFDISYYTLLIYKANAWIFRDEKWVQLYFEDDPEKDECPD